MKLRHARVAVVAALAVATAAPFLPASAHVRSGVLGGTVTPTVFRAPVEGSPDLNAHHTQALIVDLPPGLSIAKCFDSAEFACTTTDLQAIWTRKPGSTFATADYFRVDIQTPPIGTLVFDMPATQIYSDGEIVRWDANDQTAPHPAPQLSVKTPPALAKPLVTTGAFSTLFGAPTTLKITGTATVTRGAPKEGDTTLVVDVSGLEPGVTYPVHLHEGTCGDLGPHYMTDPLGVAGPPNELWASSDPNDPTHGITADATGHALGSGLLSGFSPARPSARSVFLHLPGEPAGGGGGGNPHAGHLLSVAAAADPHAAHGARIACADLRVPAPTAPPGK